MNVSQLGSRVLIFPTNDAILNKTLPITWGVALWKCALLKVELEIDKLRILLLSLGKCISRKTVSNYRSYCW